MVLTGESQVKPFMLQANLSSAALNTVFRSFPSMKAGFAGDKEPWTVVLTVVKQGRDDSRVGVGPASMIRDPARSGYVFRYPIEVRQCPLVLRIRQHLDSAQIV